MHCCSSGACQTKIGRRVGVVAAIGLGIASTLVFLFANCTGGLCGARIFSGLATGLGAGAATAWIAELQPRGDRAVAAALASVANLVGLAVAPLLAGALARFAPAPLRLPYVAYLVLLVAAGAAVLRTPETVDKPIRRWAELGCDPASGCRGRSGTPSSRQP